MPESLEERLIVFTRYPETGKTKTRLIPALGAQGAAGLQRRLTERVLGSLTKPLSLRKVAFEVRYEGGSRKQMQSWLGTGALLAVQGNGSLGRRMQRAFADAFAAGCRAAVIIGTDIPQITAAIVERAFDRLRDNDVVLGPAADGGYYLIGLRDASFGRARCLLSDGIPWGTEKVLQVSLQRAEQSGLNAFLLSFLKDIDRPEDLPILEEISRSPAAESGADRISIIIPALNEAGCIEATLGSLKGADNVEVILVDGGSSDGTPEIARRLGANVLPAKPRRALQMNAGARVATGGILLFLHADTRLPPGFDRHVRLAVRKPKISAGAFALGIASPSSSLRIMERVANLRSRYAMLPYGDQGIFVPAALFGDIGGFADMPIMEDFDLVRRLKRKGRIEILPAAVQTSARRWLSVGIWRTWWINVMMVAGYYLGVRTHRLAALYRRERKHG